MVVHGATIHQVVFGVDFKKAQRRRLGMDVGKVLGLEAHTHARSLHGALLPNQAFSLNAASWPMPVGELGEAVFSQVPLGTKDQEFPW